MINITPNELSVDNAFNLPPYKQSNMQKVFKKIGETIFNAIGFIFYCVAVINMRLIYNIKNILKKLKENKKD